MKNTKDLFDDADEKIYGYNQLQRKYQTIKSIVDNCMHHDLLEGWAVQMVGKIEAKNGEITIGQAASIRATYDKLAYFGIVEPLGQLKEYLNGRDCESQGRSVSVRTSDGDTATVARQHKRKRPKHSC